MVRTKPLRVEPDANHVLNTKWVHYEPATTRTKDATDLINRSKELSTELGKRSV